MAESVINITLVGDQKLLKGLDTASDFAKQELAKALNKAAVDISNNAKENAPHKTGRLAASINITYATPENLEAKIGPSKDVPYALAQEFGTVGMVIHSHSKNGNQFTYIGNIPAKHYMTNAKDAVKPKLSTYLQEAAKRIVDHMAGNI